jgi:alkylation response protein AidB-like acyl-CoA dehydrogenase
VEEGGFRLTGRWNYGSGILHATHVHACAIVMEGDQPRKLPSGEPEMRMFVIPPDQVQLYRDWDVVGLRATGSIDYSVEDVFIPQERSYLARSNESPLGGALFRIGITGFALIGHTGFALGMARRVLDEIAKLAQTSRALSGSDKFLQDFASAESAYRAAKAFALDEWRRAEELTQQGPLPTRQVTLLRMALIHATNAAVDICNFAYRAAGGRALRRCPIERCLRDMLAGAQHLHVSPGILTECGREIAGLVPKARWAGFALIAQ